MCRGVVVGLHYNELGQILGPRRSYLRQAHLQAKSLVKKVAITNKSSKKSKVIQTMKRSLRLR